MSTEKIFGSWDTPSDHKDHLETLWHNLAAQHVGTADFQPNFGLSQRKAEIIMLWSLFERQKPKVVVEIGVAQGGTFAAWCILAPDDATLIGIDRDCNDCRPRPGDQVNPLIWPHSGRMTHEGGGLYLLKQRNQRVHPINGWSHEESTLSQLRAILDGREIDFLFHDASHSKEMTWTDYQIYWPMIAEGGIMAFHDIWYSKADGCDKYKSWEKIKNEAKHSACFEFLPGWHDDSLGIGVLIK